MGLFDSFRKPKWENKDPKIRLEAVKELDDKAIIENLAKNDSDWKVRSESIEKIDEENILIDLYKSESDSIVRMGIVSKIKNQDVLKDIVRNDSDEDVRSSAIKNIRDEKLLLYVIRSDRSVYVRKSATYRLTHVAESMRVFEELSKNGEPDDIKLLAMDFLNNPKVLEMVEGEQRPIEINEDKQKLPEVPKQSLPNDIKNFKYLDDMIHSGKSEICLDFDIALGDDESSKYAEGIKIDAENLIIDGKKHAIDANGKGRIFDIGENAKITLKNIAFLNANYEAEYAKGGAIYNESGELSLEACYFKNNTLSSDSAGGSAIYSNNSIIMKDCIFEDNFLDDGSGTVKIILKADEERKIVKLDNCTFRNNHVMKGRGSALVIKGNLINHTIELVNCNFENNILTNGKGGVCYLSSGKIILKYCNFKNNRVNGGEGSAIYQENSYEQSFLKLEKCVFKKNVANTLGPGNYLKGYGTVYSEGFLICENCIFEDNEAVLASGICNYDNECNIINTVFKDTHDNSGSIFLQLNKNANSYIEHCKFIVYSAGEEIIRLIYGFCIIKNSKFHSNNLQNEGRAIFNKYAITSIYKSKFYGNNKLIFNDNILKIERDYELEDLIESGDNSSPLIYLNEKVNENIKGFTYLDNLIQSDSNFIELKHDIRLDEAEQNFYEGGIELDQDNLTIDGNHHVIDANGLSRVFYITGRNITLKNITFKNGMYYKNYLDDEYAGGAVIYTIHDSSLSIIDCVFIENISRNSGGAITAKGKITLLKNSKFINNKCMNNGTITGCHNSFLLSDCCFESNSGNKGGAISYCDGTGFIKKCTFKDNTSQYRGGGAICAYGSVISIEDSEFNNNLIEYSTYEGGGAIFNYLSFVKILKSYFYRNIAAKGGAIYNYGGNAIIDESNFKYNLARTTVSIGTGDAIYNNSKEIIIKNSAFDSSTPQIIYNEGILDISSSNFKDHHIISNEEGKGTVKIHGKSLKEIIDGGNVEVIESEDNSIIDKHDRLSVDEYKTKFKEGIDTQNSNLAESIADEWIDEYPRDYEGHYAYVIANIDGDIEDLKRHMAFAFACTPPNEFNKSKFEKEAKLAIVLRYGFYEANLK